MPALNAELFVPGPPRPFVFFYMMTGRLVALFQVVHNL